MVATYTDRLQGVATATAFKAPVRVATTANITLSGLQTIDGVTVEAGDRVLVKDQTSGIDNGIWVASAGGWSRALDFNDPRDVRRGTLVNVISGATGGLVIYEVSTDDPVSIGASVVSFRKAAVSSDSSVVAGVQAHGALGDGATNDTAAFTAALAATTGPVYVPWTAQHYVLTALSEADRKRLWGPGKLVVAGTAQRISSAPWLDNDRAILRAVNKDWQPSKWASVDASLHNGVLGAELRRTGGFGTYGALLVNLTVPADTPYPQTDFAITGWVTKQNMSGGAGFGGWLGCNTPGRELAGQTFSAGRVNGAEINVGNRWGVGAYLVGPGNPLETTGLKIVPDVLPAEDGPAYEAIDGITIASPGVVTKNAHGYFNGMQLRIYARSGTLPGGLTEGGQYYTVGVTTNTFQLSATRGGAPITTTGSFAAGVAVLPSYPCSFGLIIGKSIWDHRWWTGMTIPTDSIMAGGIGMRLHGGSALAEAPSHLTISDGYYTHGAEYAGNFTNGIVITGSGQRGIRMDTAALSGAAVLMGAGQRVSWGGASLISGDGNTLNMSTGNTAGVGTLSANNTAIACLRWDGNGSARLGFYGTSPQAKPSITGSRGANAALADLITKLAALGLITDSTT